MDIPLYKGKVPFVTADQMKEVDRAIIEDFHIELTQMMENAGRNLAHLARIRFLDNHPVDKKVVVLAGSGGNGGSDIQEEFMESLQEKGEEREEKILPMVLIFSFSNSFPLFFNANNMPTFLSLSLEEISFFMSLKKDACLKIGDGSLFSQLNKGKFYFY